MNAESSSAQLRAQPSWVAETVEELEGEIGLPSGSLQSTVDLYNRHAAEGSDPVLGKKSEWVKPIVGPFAAIDLRGRTGGITLGGLKTTVDSEVLHVSGAPIPGLFAAGRCTSGVCAGGYASGTSPRRRQLLRTSVPESARRARSPQLARPRQSGTAESAGPRRGVSSVWTPRRALPRHARDHRRALRSGLRHPHLPNRRLPVPARSGRDAAKARASSWRHHAPSTCGDAPRASSSSINGPPTPVRNSQPSPSGSGRHIPRPGTMTGFPALGAATRSGAAIPLAPATQPNSSTTNAGPVPAANSGAARERRRSSEARVLAPQRRLREANRGAHQRDGGGMHRSCGSTDVHHAQYLARPWVVYGRAGTRPIVMRGRIVLGREELHRRVFDQRGTYRVGPHRLLRPACAFREPESVRRTFDGLRPFAPEQDTVGVGNDHDEARVLGDLGERGSQFGQNASQRGTRTPRLQLGEIGKQ